MEDCELKQRVRLILCWGIVGLLGPPTTVCAQSLPDFMESWEFGLNVDEDEGPSYFADILLPLYRDSDRTRLLFVEPRVRYADRSYLFNSGLGFRQLALNQSWLLGMNVFHDYDTDDSHYRVGWGAEALSAYAEARTNMYIGLSQKRLVEENAGGNTFEEAVNGWDFELGAPVPYYSRLKVFGGYNFYNFEEFKNRYGWTLRAEYKPFPFLVIDGLVSDSTKSNVDWGMTVAFRIPLGDNAPQSWHSPLQWDATAFPESDASEFLYSLVERHHEIVVERWRQTGTLTVEVARGT